MSKVDNKLSRLSPEKRVMLEKLLREKQLQQARGEPRIESIKLESNRYPLTFAQEKIWIANNINPDATIYNIIGLARIQGNAHMNWFIEALGETFDRHEILKTHFKQDRGELYCEIDEEMSFKPELHDFSDKSCNRDVIIEEMMNKLARTPFDLEKDTLIRAALICTAPEDWTVILVMHHLVGDAMSIGVVLGETLEYCYNKYNGIENKKQPLSIQFKDFAWWERSKEAEPLSAELAKKYWNEQLDGADFSLDLLKEEQGLTHFDEIALRKDIHISADVVNKIQRIAQKEKVTVFSIYFSALQLLIYKYSMQKDFMTGVITSGRDLAQVQPMVGCFVDILPVRTVVNEFLTFADFARASYKNFLGNFEKKDAYQKRGDSPIYQLLFNYKENPESTVTINGLKIHSQEVDNGFSRASIDFDLIKSGGAIIGGINYRKGVLDDEFVQEFIARYYLILDEITDSTSIFLNQRISEIEIIDKSERHQILNDFNATQMPYPENKTVVELFEVQVKKAPDNIAMIFEDKHMTYRQLNEKANALARKLRDMGTKPGDYVALMAERSMELVIGIYGIIKSGGAYVPIDTECPKERLSYMLTDCDAKALLTYRADVDKSIDIPVISLADVSVYEGDKSNLPIVNTAEDDFYLIYTSGTTGEPKGVMCLHKGTVNLISYLQKNYPIDYNNTVLQKTAYTFDASIVEIFRWSLTGARGCLLSPGDEKDPYRTCEAIYEHGVTEMQVVPSMLKTMIAAIKSDKGKYGPMLKTLRYVFTGGEAITVDGVSDFYKVFDKYSDTVSLINTYGPTETSIEAAHYHLKAGEKSVSIGKPVGNYQAYILNGTALCGIGMIGELCISGVGVTKGYLNSETLTNKKFIDNPFGQGKLYRTGDAARWLPDGNIEYLGRIDEQVKIRGFRIELGEIESCLRSIDGITDAVAIVQTGETGDKTLCAYVQTLGELDTEHLKVRLRNHLPDYMVPGHFMKIETIPVTSSGKLNKKALPEIEITTSKVYTAPTTENEKIVVQIFEELFGLSHLGIKESFFELGGNSLKATLLVNQIEQATGVRLGIKDVFQGVTVEGIGLALENLEGSYEPIPKAEFKDFYPISPSQKIFFLTAHLWDYNATDMASNISMAFILNGAYEVEKAEFAFETLLQRHEIFRTSFHFINGETVMRIHDHIEMDMLYEDHCAKENIGALARDFFRPFDLTKAPLIRAKVVKTGAEDFVLFLDFHHIIADGLSVDLFFTEFMTLYMGGELAPVGLQYRDYSEWALKRPLHEQEAYWTNHFANNFANGIPRLYLPEDYPRQKERKFDADMVVKTLDKNLSDKVINIGNKMDMTPFMGWLSMTMILLCKYSHEEAIVVGTTVSGRTHRDTEDIQGPLINRLLLSGKPEQGKALVQFFKEIKETCLMAYENQDFPLVTLVQQLEPQAHLDKSRAPLYDVHYVFFNDENELLNEAKMDVLQVQTAKDKFVDESITFDLVCKVAESNGEYTLSFFYRTSLFKRKTIEGLMDRLIQILEQLGEDENQTIEMLTSQL